MLSVSRFLSSESQIVAGSGTRPSRNSLLLSVVAVASLLLGGASASATSTTVAGVTPGAIAVDESGSANYSIPISVPPGVDLSADDRLCLDGQRLVATEGTYGADGTVYSTELASFSKIVSYGTAGAGPAYFKVWTKSGQVMIYGNTADGVVR